MNRKTIILLIIIIGIAAFFRFAQLDSLPPGLYPDEAINGNQALTDPGKIFYAENNGREGLYVILLSFSFYLFGASIASMKLVSALFGIFTVLGVYFLTKELFHYESSSSQKANIIAIIASFFIAASFWHTLFSRMGFRAIMVPFAIVWGVFFLLKALRTGKTKDFIFSGIFWGFGCHSYIAFRLTPLILIVVLSATFINYLRKNKLPNIKSKWNWRQCLSYKNCWKISILILTALLVAAPLIAYFFCEPQDFMGRAGGVSVFAQENSIKALGESTIKHLGMFNFYGDANWRHNYSGRPMLPWAIGILFLTGLAISFKELVRSFLKKSYSAFTAYSLLIGWFFTMLLPGILTAEGLPHALRVIGVIPVVYIFAAIGSYWIWEMAKKQFLRKTVTRYIFVATAIVLLLISAGLEFHKYFLDWAVRTETANAFSRDYVNIGHYLNTVPESVQKYVIVNQGGVLIHGIPMPAQTVMFIENTKIGRKNTIYILPEDIDRIQTRRDAVIVPMHHDDQLSNRLLTNIPHIKIQDKEGFQVYKIKH